jgi:hypothetical protein
VVEEEDACRISPSTTTIDDTVVIMIAVEGREEDGNEL